MYAESGAKAFEITAAPEETKSFKPHPIPYLKSPKGKSLSMMFLERQGCFDLGAKTFIVQRATAVEDLCAAYKLVRDCLGEKIYLFPNPSRLRMRSYEALPETATFVAKAANRVVGVTSIVVDSPGLGLPSEKLYPQEVETLRCPSGKICEITNVAIASDYRLTSVLTELIRCGVAHLLAIGCDNALASINPNHKAFYKLMGFNAIGNRWNYSHQIPEPAILVQLPIDNLMEKFTYEESDDDHNDITVLKHYYMDNNPYHDQIDLWSANVRKAFSDPVFLRQLFVERSNLLGDCTAGELEVIRDYWGDELFLNVLGHNILQDGFLPL